MATVTLDNIQKRYEDGTLAVKGISLDIQDGEFVVLVGPSGCGKSTALRMVAGLEDITGGKLVIGERVVNDVAPRDRDIAMVFQNYALYPHMTVRKNIAYPLKIAGLDQAQIDERVEKAARTLQLEEYLHRKPGALSGGQRQRVAMGRAIVREPSVFLMDEPLSNLDAKLRVYMRSEIGRIHTELGVTTMYVTHDQVEAMTLGDRVVVLKDGELQQFDTPRNLYANPANLFVAGFIGSPAMNTFETKVRIEDERRWSSASATRTCAPTSSCSTSAPSSASTTAARWSAACAPRSSTTSRCGTARARGSPATSSWSRRSDPRSSHTSTSARAPWRPVTRTWRRSVRPTCPHWSASSTA